jgi:putative membrane protein
MSSKTDKNELAQDRTDWAEDRTTLANERTFAGWMRTGMASIAIAVGLRAVFAEADPTWIPKLVSTLFIGAALFIFWSARINACKAQARLDEHQAEVQSKTNFTILATLFSIGGVTVGIVLWTL